MPISQNRSLRILFLTSEYEPFAKVGGLGDYSGSLPKSICGLTTYDNREIDIRLAMPFHGQFNSQSHAMSKAADLIVTKRVGYARGFAFEFIHNTLPIYLIRRQGNSSGYQSIYNSLQIEDARKYVFFSLAIQDLVKKINWQPDIIHANDWHTSISVRQFAQIRSQLPTSLQPGLLQVIHNMPFLGEGTHSVMREFGVIPVKNIHIPKWAEYLPLPMGVVSSDRAAAVSPTYMQELTTQEFGDGMAEYFIQNRHKTTGILNGIDTTVWNPETDPEIEYHFSIDNLAVRQKNKMQLLKEFDLNSKVDHPLLVFISRLTSQKGVEILLDGLPEILDSNWNVIFLGYGQQDLEIRVKNLQKEHPDRFRSVLEFNATLAHKLYASGDILLMPSLYEPCGLSQLIAMRYGCVPVARSVGGLKDSITSQPDTQKTGYLFESANANSFIQCMAEALRDFKNKPKWDSIQRRAMEKDFSWKRSARQYVDLYEEIITERK